MLKVSEQDRAKKATGGLSDATVFSAFAIQGDGVWMQVELNEAGNRTQLFVGTDKTSWADYTNDYYNPGTMVIKSVTGLTQLAKETGSTEEKAVRTNEAASNRIPNITVVAGTQVVGNKNTLILNVNESRSITVKGEDDGSILNYLVLGNSGAELSIELEDRSRNVTLKLTDTNPKNLSVTVTDSNNVSAPILDIVLVVCSLCSGHGTCNTSVLRETHGNPNYKLATCQCELYWTGDDCQFDFDACAENPCSVGRNCTDTNADAHKGNPSIPTYTCTPCPAGFEDNNAKCEDIDECKNLPCGLSSKCVNTEGSFSCVCNAGYRLSSTNKTACNDINECEESTSGCDQVCNNTQGYFTCSCYAGYTFNSTSNQCKQGTLPNVCKDQCNGTDGCVDDNNSPKCFCNAGYQLNGGNTRCDGKDECGAGSDRCDPAGWTGTTCDTDINECETPNKCKDANKLCDKGLCDKGLCDKGLCDKGLCDKGLCDKGLCDKGLCDKGLCDKGLCDKGLCDKGLCDKGLCDKGLCEKELKGSPHTELCDKGLYDKGLCDKGLCDKGVVNIFARTASAASAVLVTLVLNYKKTARNAF
ncbi:hypothetical protein DPMN_006890 [Dreissena polymorpha]|uniref:EGF-like domain-containing protein n=1 Tax=Dreissena polymorpha TaxID=45954 RepID=A0A9D4RXV7_DREPO|nr:hypothetical protein DPMN_006890 [Dreissena polymorpha]